MRQAGIIAAGALYALENNINRLKEDHVKARRFAEEISQAGGVDIDLKSVQTNIVVLKVKKDADTVKSGLEGRGLLVTSEGTDRIRAVFHMDVSNEQTDEAIKIFKEVLD
jgi:threonine aldolase